LPRARRGKARARKAFRAEELAEESTDKGGTGMLYICEIRTRRPPELSEDEWQALLEAEWRRGRELVDAGNIIGIWRIAGALANVSVWQADNHEELHRLLTSLPLAPHQEVSLRPALPHPVFWAPK
jgi:muconolactone D-isomerase